MFERLKRFLRTITTPPDDEPDSIDHPRPQRANPNPPQRDWFARTRDKSFKASAAKQAAALDRLDESELKLSQETSRQVGELLAKAGVGSRGGGARGNQAT
jgi:hypothetical protein